MDLGACSPNSCCQRMERRTTTTTKNPNQQGRNPGARGAGREVGADQMVVQLVPAWMGIRRKISMSKTSMETYGSLKKDMFMEEKMPTGLRGEVFSKLLPSCFLGSQWNPGFSSHLHLQLTQQLPKKMGQGDLSPTALIPGQ